jgi:L-ribulose-5-phosphate 4-epimerase
MAGAKGRYAALREEALAANLEIPKLSLAILTWGNASAYDPSAGAFAIKPSGVEYPDLREEDMVVVDLEGRVVEGSMRPSSDTKTHAVLYKSFKGIRGICHTHSTFATAWAQTRRPLPCFGTTHADQVAGPVPCTEMLGAADVERDYELGTGELIARTLAGKPALETPMILVAGHGPFAWGSTAMKAVRYAAALEEVAHLAFITSMLDGNPAALPDYIVRKHFERKHGASAYYGQAGDTSSRT